MVTMKKLHNKEKYKEKKDYHLVIQFSDRITIKVLVYIFLDFSTYTQTDVNVPVLYLCYVINYFLLCTYE